MRISTPGAVAGAALLLVLPAGLAAAADADHGKALYQACAACHTERPDALGPSLKGVFGRLVRKGAHARLILAVDLIGQAVSVEVDAADVRAY